MNDGICDFRFAICDLLRKAAASLTADYADFTDRKRNIGDFGFAFCNLGTWTTDFSFLSAKSAKSAVKIPPPDFFTASAKIANRKSKI
jgi:hypothetical protein